MHEAVSFLQEENARLLEELVQQ